MGGGWFRKVTLLKMSDDPALAGHPAFLVSAERAKPTSDDPKGEDWDYEGVRIFDLPMTPEKVLRALGERDQAGRNGLNGTASVPPAVLAVPGQPIDFPAGAGIPQSDGIVQAGRRHLAAVGRQGDGPRPGAVRQFQALFPGCRVPQAHRAVVTGRRH